MLHCAFGAVLAARVALSPALTGEVTEAISRTRLFAGVVVVVRVVDVALVVAVVLAVVVALVVDVVLVVAVELVVDVVLVVVVVVTVCGCDTKPLELQV